MTLRCIIGLVSFNRERERERGREGGRERETERDRERATEERNGTQASSELCSMRPLTSGGKA